MILRSKREPKIKDFSTISYNDNLNGENRRTGSAVKIHENSHFKVILTIKTLLALNLREILTEVLTHRSLPRMRQINRKRNDSPADEKT